MCTRAECVKLFGILCAVHNFSDIAKRSTCACSIIKDDNLVSTPAQGDITTQAKDCIQKMAAMIARCSAHSSVSLLNARRPVSKLFATRIAFASVRVAPMGPHEHFNYRRDGVVVEIDEVRYRKLLSRSSQATDCCA